MWIILSALLPVFGLILIGMAAERLRLIPMGGAAALNQMVFNLSMPCMIFSSMAASDVSELLQPGYAAATLAGGMICLALAQGLVSGGFRRRHGEAAVIAMLAAFPNAAFLGLPIVTSLLPGDHDAVIAATITIVLGLPFILICMIVLEWGRGGAALSRRALLRKVTRVMLLNPILLATVLGAVVCAARIPLPQPLLAVFRLLGGTCTPCALVALGMVLSIQMTSSGGIGQTHLRWQLLVYSVKLALMPFVTWELLAFLGVPGRWIFVGVLLAAMPTGTMGYVLSETYNVCTRDASRGILVSTALSALTLPLMIWLLQNAGLLGAR